MEPRYKVGQKVMVRPAKSQAPAARDSAIEQYAGQTGIVSDFYWIKPNTGDIFYVYMVKLGEDEKEIVLHEDEIEAY